MWKPALSRLPTRVSMATEEQFSDSLQAGLLVTYLQAGSFTSENRQHYLNNYTYVCISVKHEILRWLTKAFDKQNYHGTKILRCHLFIPQTHPVTRSKAAPATQYRSVMRQAKSLQARCKWLYFFTSTPNILKPHCRTFSLKKYEASISKMKPFTK